MSFIYICHLLRAPITKTIQVRRSQTTQISGYCWRSKDELESDVLLWTQHIWPSKSRMTSPNLHTASYVRTQDVTQKTCQRR